MQGVLHGMQTCVQWIGDGVSELPFPFNLVGDGISAIFAGFKARDLTNANMRAAAACVVVLAATLSEFGSQVGGGKESTSTTEEGSRALTEAQENIIKSIAEEDLVQLQKLIDKWAKKYKATRFFGFGAQDFVDSFKKIREQLNLKLNSLTTSMTITIQTKMMDFQLAVIDNLEEIADKIDQVAEKQEAALKHIQAMGFPNRLWELSSRMHAKEVI